VVAVSYPKTFSIDANADARARERDGGPSRVGAAYGSPYGFGARSYFWDPFYYGSWGYNPYNSYRGISLMGFGNGYGFNSSGYPYYGGYNPYGGGYGGWGGRYVTVQVERTSPQERGRVVNGRGYRRPGGSGGTASPAGSYSGGSGSATSGGSSGGSSGGGRTAKPRRRGGRF